MDFVPPSVIFRYTTGEEAVKVVLVDRAAWRVGDAVSFLSEQ